MIKKQQLLFVLGWLKVGERRSRISVLEKVLKLPVKFLFEIKGQEKKKTKKGWDESLK